MRKPVRIIPMLEIKNGLLIKGINFEGFRVLGNARDFAQLYYSHGADEICYQDSVATLFGTSNLKKYDKNSRLQYSQQYGHIMKSSLSSVLVFGPESVPYERSRRENSIEFHDISTRACVEKYQKVSIK